MPIRPLTSKKFRDLPDKKTSAGSRDGRAKLATVLECSRSGDELVVTWLYRLALDTRDVLNLIHEAEERGAQATVLDPHVSFSSSAHETADFLLKRIVPIDGQQLAHLIIRHNVGCRIEKTLMIKKLDEELFDG